MEDREAEADGAGRGRTMESGKKESTEEESEWQARVEKRLEWIEELLEGLGLQIAAFQEVLSILAGKFPNKDPYRDGKNEKEKEGEDDDMEE